MLKMCRNTDLVLVLCLFPKTSSLLLMFNAKFFEMVKSVTPVFYLPVFFVSCKSINKLFYIYMYTISVCFLFCFFFFSAVICFACGNPWKMNFTLAFCWCQAVEFLWQPSWDPALVNRSVEEHGLSKDDTTAEPTHARQRRQAACLLLLPTDCLAGDETREREKNIKRADWLCQWAKMIPCGVVLQIKRFEIQH